VSVSEAVPRRPQLRSPERLRRVGLARGTERLPLRAPERERRVRLKGRADDGDGGKRVADDEARLRQRRVLKRRDVNQVVRVAGRGGLAAVDREPEPGIPVFEIEDGEESVRFVCCAVVKPVSANVPASLPGLSAPL
jgi:hypothetical protein